MKKLLALIFAACLVALAPSVLVAQGTQVAFGSFNHDASLPVEITADALEISQADGTAIFRGNVVIGQGDLRMSAGQVLVVYASGDDATGQISRLTASGGVTLVNGAEAAEAQEATYSIDEGLIVMSGGVILTQGRNALSAERLVVNLKTGTGTLEGRVKTILQTDGN